METAGIVGESGGRGKGAFPLACDAYTCHTLGIVFLRVGDLPLYYEESGAGRPLLFLHGLAGSSYCWRGVTSLLPHYRCLALDLKGHGESGKPADSAYRISDHAEIVVEVIRCLDLQEVVLVGHSLGGAIALSTASELARESEDRVRALVLMNAICFPQRIPWFLQMLRVPAVGQVTASMAPARLVVSRSFQRGYHDRTRITEEVVAEHARCMDLPGARAALMATIRALDREPIWELAPQITLPALVLWGRHDPSIPLSLGQQLAEALPQGRLAVLEHCGHYPQKERPIETAAVLAEFLAGLE